MKLIAKEVANAKPDLVGLQEVTRWSTGPAGHKPTHVVIDYLATIMSELKRLHAPIMAKPAVKLVRSFVTGRETTAAGRHPSDHGGVVTVLAFT